MKALTILAMLALTGCGRSNTPVPASVPLPMPTVETPESSASSTTHEDNYWLAGMDNEAEARRFVVKLQAAVEHKNKAALIGAVRYPFTHWQKGKSKVYRSRSELAPHYDRVFTAKVLLAIREWDREGLFVNYQGAMISSGAVWFDRSPDHSREQLTHGGIPAGAAPPSY
jgi:hypothetical protein